MSLFLLKLRYRLFKTYGRNQISPHIIHMAKRVLAENHKYWCINMEEVKCCSEIYQAYLIFDYYHIDVPSMGIAVIHRNEINEVKAISKACYWVLTGAETSFLRKVFERKTMLYEKITSKDKPFFDSKRSVYIRHIQG